MERIAPPSLNYDNVLPLAIESRSNRRTFVPVNGSSFSNTTGSTIIRIDVNADSMLDPTHSYLTLDLCNDAPADANGVPQFLHPEIGPAMIQRMRIESGGVTIEDINEYGRLYTAMMLNQCPEDYVNNVCGSYNLYPQLNDTTAQLTAAKDGAIPNHQISGNIAPHAADAADVGGFVQGGLTEGCEIKYMPNISSVCAGLDARGTVQVRGDGATLGLVDSQLNVNGYAEMKKSGAIGLAGSKTITIPLLSGFLNQDKYIPLIMMNAGFTIELHLAPVNAVGLTQSIATGISGVSAGVPAAAHANGGLIDNVWSIKNVKYVANLIDLDREFYGRLRSVMEESGGVLQLAGQTYRHYSAVVPLRAGEGTVSLPARVKSIKSIFATFITATHRNSNASYNTSVYHNAGLSAFRFEIGSVRYPQTDIKTGNGNRAELVSELHKAFGKLGDYSHSTCVRAKGLECIERIRTNQVRDSGLAGFMLGYDFEAFQKVALESGINTADRSLPLNFVYNKDVATTGSHHADFYVLSDAIYYINLDGTVSVSV